MRTLNNALKVKPGLTFLLVIAIYTVPLKWLAGWMSAIVIHELSHILAIKAMGIKIKRIGFGISGAIIETEPMKRCQEMLSALAGPVIGFSPVFAGRYWPCLALCAFVQSVYNLLPIYPLDGGRALRCIACIAFGENKGRIIFRYVEVAMIFLILLCLLYCCCVFSLGIVPFIILVLVTVRLYQIKFPCKRRRKIVQ